MRAARAIPLGAYDRIPAFLPMGPDSDPLAVLTKVTLLGVDREATAKALEAQQTVRQANPKLAAEWDDWAAWCRRWQADVVRRLDEKTSFFGANDDAYIESSELEHVKAQLLEWKLRWAQAGAAQMGYPQAQPKAPEQPPVVPPIGPGGGGGAPGDKPGSAADETNWPLVLGLLAAAAVAFHVARGPR
jgi:hypothetical protein